MTYLETKVYILIVAIVIIGSLNWGATAYGYNLVEILSNNLNKIFKKDLDFAKWIYYTIAVCAIILALRRNTWLPFLGKSVLPRSVIPLYQPLNANINVVVNVKPNKKVVYWAALGKNDDQNVSGAYQDYSNYGVTMSNANGEAVLAIHEGHGYKVGFGTIPRHIHYRVLDISPGMMGPVQTVKY